jgi:hypothetical protein
MGRIKANLQKPLSKQISPTVCPIGPSIIKFSFKYLDLSNPKFQVGHRGGRYVTKLVERLRDVSCLDVVSGFLCNRSSALRAHPITWRGTTEKNGFSGLNEQLRDIDGYQFEVSKKSHGRVHGFVIDSIFFVVWLDPDHKLYK